MRANIWFIVDTPGSNGDSSKWVNFKESLISEALCFAIQKGFVVSCHAEIIVCFKGRDIENEVVSNKIEHERCKS